MGLSLLKLLLYFGVQMELDYTASFDKRIFNLAVNQTALGPTEEHTDIFKYMIFSEQIFRIFVALYIANNDNITEVFTHANRTCLIIKLIKYTR